MYLCDLTAGKNQVISPGKEFHVRGILLHDVDALNQISYTSVFFRISTAMVQASIRFSSFLVLANDEGKLAGGNRIITHLKAHAAFSPEYRDQMFDIKLSYTKNSR